MRRREFLGLAAAGVVGGGLGAARPTRAADGDLSRRSLGEGAIRGRVTADGKGLANVVVSDGFQCVRTGADGSFAIPPREGARFVTVSPPCGYQMKNWYRRIGAAASYDFPLERSETGKAKCGCRFVHITDSEISEVNDVNRQWIADVKRLATSAI